MPDEMTLHVNGDEYRGWKSIEIVRSIETIADAFAVGYSDRWTYEDEPVPVSAGNACEVKIDGETIITGYVDDSDVDYDAESHSLRVAGRSKAGDLVDCSAIYKSGQWRNQLPMTIAKNVCDPFGITVSNGPKLGASGLRVAVDLGGTERDFSIYDGETCFELLDRLARMNGAIIVSEPDGNIAFARSGTQRTSTVIEYGRNIKRASRSTSWRDRFSSYIVKGQQRGDDNYFGTNAATPKATADDDNVTRHRPIIIMGEGQGSKKDLEKRAAWERNVRAGRGLTYSCTLQGWRNAEGIWAPNVLARVTDPRAGIDGDLLITSARLRRDDGGRTTELEMTFPEAFDVLDLPEESERVQF